MVERKYVCAKMIKNFTVMNGESRVWKGDSLVSTYFTELGTVEVLSGKGKSLVSLHWTTDSGSVCLGGYKTCSAGIWSFCI